MPIWSASAKWASATPPSPRRFRRLVAAENAGRAWHRRRRRRSERKSAAIDAGLQRHHYALSDPLQVARRLGGREFAAILGAVLAARQHNVPVLLDGFAATAAAAPLACLAKDALDHTKVAHCSAEAGHRVLCEQLGKRPILDLDMRLGEATGAALAVPVLRAALACYYGMATFEEANVDERS
jgi:nicotinate-nucleotide--dimethylbenzimidazole phosphoribosyltransferase